MFIKNYAFDDSLLLADLQIHHLDILGKGGFGVVVGGSIDDVLVAVKKRSNDSILATKVKLWNQPFIMKRY